MTNTKQFYVCQGMMVVPIETILDPPELLLGPQKPPDLHLSSYTYKIGVFITNNVAIKMSKCHGYIKTVHDSHLETPERLFVPLKSP